MKKRSVSFPYLRVDKLCLSAFITVSFLSAVFMPAGGLAPKAHAQKAVSSKKNVTICVGEEKTLKVKNCKEKTHAVWKSSNPKTVSVSKKGVILGKRTGSAKIDFSCRNGKGKNAGKIHISYKVEVKNYIKNMKVSPQDDVKLLVGESMQFQTTIYPVKAKEQEAAYKSENNEIASVTSRGVVTAIKEGQVHIRIRSRGKTADKKHLQAEILVHVEAGTDDTSAAEGQNTQEAPAAAEPGAPQNTMQADPPASSGSTDGSAGEDAGSIEDTGSNENEGNQNTGQDGKVTVSEETLDAIAALPEADADTLAAGVVLASYSNGETYTLYFINTAYEGSMTLTIGEYSYTMDTAPSTALRRLETMGYTAANSKNTIRIERKCIEGSTQLEEWWKVTELESKTVYEIKAMRKDTVYANKHGYGLVVVKGDTRDVIKIQ